MEELFNQLLTVGAGVAVLGVAYVIDLVAALSNVLGEHTEDKFSWKKLGKGLAKAILWAVAVLGFTTVIYLADRFAAGLGVDISGLLGDVNTVGVLGIIVTAVVRYLKNTYQNLNLFILGQGESEVVVENPDYQGIAEKVLTTIKTVKGLAKKHEEYEKEVEEEIEQGKLEGGVGTYYNIPYNTYDAFRNTVIGKGYDLDGVYDYQCPVAGTLITMQDGRYIPVELLEIGDVVKGGNRVVSNKSKMSKILKIKTSVGEFKVSPEHKLMLEDGTIKKAEDLEIGEIVKTDANPTEALYDLSDDELRFLGFWLGAGTKKYRWQKSVSPEIFVTVGTQSKEKYLESLTVTLNKRTHSNKRASIYSLENAAHELLSQIIHKLDGKELPQWFSSEQLLLILEGYLSADGHVLRSGYVATSVDKELLIGVQYACAVNNIYARLSAPIHRDSTNLCDCPQDIYRLYINQNRKFEAEVQSVEKVEDEHVYILNLDGDHLYWADNFRFHNCWDGAGLLWQQIGRWLSTGGTGAARGCWTAARNENAGNDFELIYDKSQIKRGDVVVFGMGDFGHIGFADSDYTNDSYISLLGQNQGGTPKGTYGSGFNVVNVSLGTFLGAFRFKKWIQTPAPTPTPTPTKKLKYTYKAGDTFGQVILDLGLNTAHGLWGSGGDVEYYTNQLHEQGIYGNIPVGTTITLSPRKD